MSNRTDIKQALDDARRGKWTNIELLTYGLLDQNLSLEKEREQLEADNQKLQGHSQPIIIKQKDNSAELRKENNTLKEKMANMQVEMSDLKLIPMRDAERRRKKIRRIKQEGDKKVRSVLAYQVIYVAKIKDRLNITPKEYVRMADITAGVLLHIYYNHCIEGGWKKEEAEKIVTEYAKACRQAFKDITRRYRQECGYTHRIGINHLTRLPYS